MFIFFGKMREGENMSEGFEITIMPKPDPLLIKWKLQELAKQLNGQLYFSKEDFLKAINEKERART